MQISKMHLSISKNQFFRYEPNFIPKKVKLDNEKNNKVP